MAKHIDPKTDAMKTAQTSGDDAARALLGVPGPVSYDLLRVWIADRYQVETFEIAHELGLDPEPVWFSSEGDVDHNPETDRENRDRWRAWKTEYNKAIESDPERFRRILAKICLQYADVFLEIAGIRRPVEAAKCERCDSGIDPEPNCAFDSKRFCSYACSIAARDNVCRCGKPIGLGACRHRGVTYCSSACPELPESAFLGPRG